MTWKNYGKWHIDHIRPISSFKITGIDCEDFKKCWSLSNLQPLWAFDNLSKGTKLIYNIQSSSSSSSSSGASLAKNP
jgi:hypothetical protein